jgi:pimeloyl-ACP methyl ester carboxylesterase
MPDTHPRTLCRATTADGLFLDGSLGGVDSSGTDTVFLLVHGTMSNFYAPGPLEHFVTQADLAGFASLRINTRGHDGMCSVSGPGGSVRGGATNETVSDCSLDIAAWIEFLIDRGYSRIILVGHSMGGVKSVFSQVYAPYAEVTGIVCLSPPRFAHEHWISHPDADPFRESFDRAVQLVCDGRSDELMPCRQPLPFLATAGAFVEKYGPDDRYDVVTLLPQVNCPALVIVGSRTVRSSPAFDSLPDEIHGLTDRGYAVTLQMIDGEDMTYSLDPGTPFELVLRWLEECRR